MENGNTKPTNQQRYFEIDIGFVDEDGETGTLGTWRGVAADKPAAKAQAYEAHWDCRLDTTGCSPSYQVTEMPRYVCSHEWICIFVGDREENTRWVFDRATSSLVAAQVADGSAWVNLDVVPTAKLLEDLAANKAIEQADNFGFVESNELLAWPELSRHGQSIDRPLGG